MSTAVHVPNRHQILESMRASSPSMKVFYPGDEFLVTEYCGVIRWLTPDLGGDRLKHPQTGKEVVCDGVTEIATRMGQQQTRAGVTSYVAEAAEEIVSFLTSAEGFGRVGVVALLGDDEEEHERIKAEARRLYRRARRAQAEAEWQSRLDFMKRWQDNARNRNRTPPPPNVRQQKAIDFLMAAQDGQEGTRFVSPDGTYQTDDWPKFSRYMRFTHGITPKREDYQTGERTGRATGQSPLVAEDEYDAAGDPIVSVSGGSQDAALEGHAEAVGATPGRKVTKPSPRKRGRGRGRAAHRRADR